MSRTWDEHGVSGVRQLVGAPKVEAALRSDEPIGVVLVRRGLREPKTAVVIERARRKGVRVREVTANVLRRMSSCEPPADVLALIGRRPDADLETLLAGSGAIWLLVGVAYPSNAGMAIRTAEVSGAAGVVLDANFSTTQRRFALRVSVRSDWYMPVLWERGAEVIDRAHDAGWTVVGVESVGTEDPWSVDLTERALFVAGGETHGVPNDLLTRCDRIVRVPMRGFIPSYNLQAAIAALAVERLRQLQTRDRHEAHDDEPPAARPEAIDGGLGG